MTAMDETKIETIKNWLGNGSINIFGSPFSGKDTQGSCLAEMLGGKLIGGGAILRSNIVPKHVHHHIKSGKLAPIEDYLEIVAPFLKQPFLADRPLIMSAVGRWHGEEEAIIQAATEASHPLKAVIFLELSEDNIWRRWELSAHRKDRGVRADDTAEALKVRINEYKEKTLPVIDFYRQKGLLIEIGGDSSEDEVTEEILDKLANRALA
jgi:adenylate kinase